MRGRLGVAGGRSRVAAAIVGGALACGLVPAGVASAEPESYTPPPCNTIGFHSAPELASQRACTNVGVSTHGTRPGTYLFVSPGGTFGTGAGIFQDNGSLVWWQRATAPQESDISVVHYRGHPYLAVWSGRATFEDPYGMGSVTLYNEHYQRAGVITSLGKLGANRIDAHEFRITPQGDALFGVYDPVSRRFRGRRVEVYQYIAQKVSLASGPHGIHARRLLFQWDSLKHVPLSQSHVPAPTTSTAWDYFHGNTVSQDADGNLIISSRSTWGIYKVNVKSGQTIWQVGARGDRALGAPWSFQHDVVPLGHNRYSLFDDGAMSSGCTSSSQHASRGLVIQVDPSRSPAGVKLLHAYTHAPAICSGFCGSMQLLPGGDVLIDWGEIPEITEYGRSGSRPRMDLSLSDWSCRGYRFPWVGEPLTRPAIAASLAQGATHVWASWNGSTQVTAWRVLAGTSSAHLTEIGSPTPTQSFETEIVLPHPYSEVEVQAIGAGGRVLASSHVKSTA